MNSTATLRTVTLPIAMQSNCVPPIQITPLTDTTDAGSISTQYGGYTGTQFNAGIRWNSTWASAWFSWTACGYAAA